jgi:hypothetical protein
MNFPVPTGSSACADGQCADASSSSNAQKSSQSMDKVIQYIQSLLKRCKGEECGNNSSGGGQGAGGQRNALDENLLKQLLQQLMQGQQSQGKTSGSTGAATKMG